LSDRPVSSWWPIGCIYVIGISCLCFWWIRLRYWLI
jgi:hypothetical protein